MSKWALFLYFSIISTQALSITIDQTWECHAHDSMQKQWMTQEKYKVAAINEALRACKQESETPATCHVVKDHCVLYVNGVNISPLWQCTAIDFNAHAWRSTIYNNEYDAALGAKGYCQQNSDLPETCYINLLTCFDLNKG